MFHMCSLAFIWARATMRTLQGFFRARHMDEPTKSISEVLTWLDRPEIRAKLKDTARVGKTAVKRLANCRPGGEPDSVLWMLSHLQMLSQRLMERETVGPVAARTYVSRAATMLGAYLEWSQSPVTWEPEDRRRRRAEPEPLPTTVEDELAEIYEALGRWPQMREVLFPFLMELREKRQLPSTEL